MKRVENLPRFFKLMHRAIADIGLDLVGLNVLTEAASDVFICTPLLAAMAGANVVAVTQSSRYGTAEEVMKYGSDLAKILKVDDRIQFTSRYELDSTKKIDIVTNLGFVRPIGGDLLESLPKHAVISLMWEPWELREQDIDFKKCKALGIPVIGTNESHPYLKTLEYVGVLAIKLLMESDVEVFQSNVGIIASDPFGIAIESRLIAAGAKVFRFNLPLESRKIESCLIGLDAVVIAEHSRWDEIVGEKGGIDPILFKNLGISVIHIAGNVDNELMKVCGVKKNPEGIVNKGFMTVSTAYVGPRPVIYLHCAGLYVGSEVVKHRLYGGGSTAEAVARAVSSGYGLEVPS